MSEPYIGEIRMFGGNFAPLGWMFCSGQLLAIQEFEALFNLIGTTYGGDGVTTFALPDLRGRIPIHQGQGKPLGAAAGVEMVTLLTAQLPAHAHGGTLIASSAAAEGAEPRGSLFAASEDTPYYAPFTPDKGVELSAGVVTPAGGSQPHDNMQPYLCVSFLIAVEGIFPSLS